MREIHVLLDNYRLVVEAASEKHPVAPAAVVDQREKGFTSAAVAGVGVIGVIGGLIAGIAFSRKS